MSKFELEVKTDKCQKKSCCPKLVLELVESGFSLKDENGYIIIDATTVTEDGKFDVRDLKDSIANKVTVNKDTCSSYNSTQFTINEKCVNPTFAYVGPTYNLRPFSIKSDC